MLDEAEFLQGMVPDQTRCFGFLLHPLSIGDLLILRRVRSPLLGYQGRVSYSILMEAVIIFSNRFQRAGSMLNAEWLPIFTRLWHWRLSMFGIRNVNVRRAEVVLRSHILKAYEFRPFAIPNSDAEGPQEMQSPEELILLSALMERFHMPWDEAINFSWAIGHWLYGGAAERTGTVTLTTPSGINTARQHANEEHARIAEALRTGKMVMK